MRERLAGGTEVTLVFDPNEGRRGYYDRLLAYVELNDGTDLGATLLKRGLARVYEQGNAARKPHYLELQQQARRSCVGLWKALC